MAEYIKDEVWPDPIKFYKASLVRGRLLGGCGGRGELIKGGKGGRGSVRAVMGGILGGMVYWSQIPSIPTKHQWQE